MNIPELEENRVEEKPEQTPEGDRTAQILNRSLNDIDDVVYLGEHYDGSQKWGVVVENGDLEVHGVRYYPNHENYMPDNGVLPEKESW